MPGTGETPLPKACRAPGDRITKNRGGGQCIYRNILHFRQRLKRTQPSYDTSNARRRHTPDDKACMMSHGMPPPALELPAAESMIIPRVRHLSALDIGAFGAQLPLHVLLREATDAHPGD